MKPTTISTAATIAMIPPLVMPGRPGKCVDRNWLVAGESADFFVGGLWITFVPDDLHPGFCRRFADGSPHRRRHGIHVRSGLAAHHSPAQLVSRGHAAAAFVGDLASGV